FAWKFCLGPRGSRGSLPGPGAGALQFLGQNLQIVLELADGLTLDDDLVNAVKSGGEDPQEEAEQDHYPEGHLGGFHLDQMENQFQGHRLPQYLQVLDNKDEGQEDDN